MINPTIIISKLSLESFSLMKQIAENNPLSKVVFISDAVYMLTIQGIYSDEFKKLKNMGVIFYAISIDVLKRGIKDTIEGVVFIDYNNLVDLLLNESKSIINL